MPKVSEYELEHLNDDRFSNTEKVKKKKPSKEKKYQEKKDYRSEWKIRKKIEESLEPEEDVD